MVGLLLNHGANPNTVYRESFMWVSRVFLLGSIINLNQDISAVSVPSRAARYRQASFEGQRRYQLYR